MTNIKKEIICFYPLIYAIINNNRDGKIIMKLYII